MNAMIVTSLPPAEMTAMNDSVNTEPMKPTSFSAKQNFNTIGSIPMPSGPRNIPKKPMRPLTAYHIFFQIEREYIIQSLPGAKEDVQTASNKRLLDDVPDRYKDIKLSPDWYFGPGKRPKRKHRKAHGKIGFMELSRIIASRWAELDTLDSEVKAFVQMLAKQELDEYMEDMKKYKELTAGLKTVEVPTSSPKPVEVSQTQNKSTSTSKKRPLRPVRRETSQPATVQATSVPSAAPMDLSNEIDYFISRINNDARQLLPSRQMPTSQNAVRTNTQSPFSQHPRQERRNSLLNFLEGVFDTVELEQDVVIHQQQQPMKKQRRNSPSTVAVDICDDEIIRMWKENNLTA
jgi:hypothetical protein